MSGSTVLRLDEFDENFRSAGVRASLLEYLHACPICDHTRLRHYCRVPSLFTEHEFIRYERCASCGTVFRNPRLTTVVRESKYEDKIMPESHKRLEPLNQIHYAYMMRLINRLKPPGMGNRVLDFGCGNAGFMLEARKAGFEVEGLEINKDLVGFVEEKYGISVYQGLVTDEAFTSKRFDLILSSQVFEHLVDPRGTLQALIKNLNTPGMLLIEVPNLRHISERLHRGAKMDDSHLFYFSASNLSRLMESVGLEVIRVEEGARLYRVMNGRFKDLPDALHQTVMTAASLCQVRTGLSVLARRV